MAEEIQEAVQIIRVGYDGIEIAMKLGGASIEQIKKFAGFLFAVMDHEKAMGKTDMRKLLVKGGDLQVLKFAAGEQRQVEKLAKKYGILYSVLPDINKHDGMCEIIFHTEAVPRVNMMLQKLKSGRLATFDDYLNNGDKKEMDKVLSFLKKQKPKSGRFHTEEDARAREHLLGLVEKAGMYASSKKDISAEEIRKKFHISYKQAEEAVGKLEEIGVLSSADNGQHKVLMDQEAFIKRIRRYQELAGRIKAAAAKEHNFVDITLSKKLATEENSHAVKVRLPGTWGENARYLWLPKEQAAEIHDGKTLLAFLDCNKEYKLYSADNKSAGTMKGSILYKKHFDRVAEEVRKNYEKEKKMKTEGKKQPEKKPVKKKKESGQKKR
ncbi:MAG: PcfB family protein [Lachnospiraceae bacterium]